MNVNDFWQENKRFVVTVAGAVVVFFTGVMVINSVFGDDLALQLSKQTRLEATLAGPLFQQSDLDVLRTENRALVSAHETLTQATVFVPRADFAPDAGSLAQRYFEVVARTRDALLPTAGRAGIPVPENLGLPALAPTKDEQIVRHLEALDLIDRVLRLAFEAGIGRVEALEIKLDPRLVSGKPLEGLEKTLVTFKLRGNAESLVRLSLLCASTGQAKQGVLERCEFLSGGAREDEARLELVLAAARLHQAAEEKP